MTQCQHCGETSFYPAGPHNGFACPLKQAESDARVAATKAEEEYWHKRRVSADRSRL
jgi:hypothetical protein